MNGCSVYKNGPCKNRISFVLAVVVAGEIWQLLTCSGFAKL